MSRLSGVARRSPVQLWLAAEGDDCYGGVVVDIALDVADLDVSCADFARVELGVFDCLFLIPFEVRNDHTEFL